MKHRRLMVAAVAGGLAALPACSSSTHSPAGDVTVTACRADPGGGRPTADGHITNHTSKASSYAFGVTFDDASGNRVTAGAATVGKVDAGADATWHVTGATDAKGPLTCKISGVTRAVAP